MFKHQFCPVCKGVVFSSFLTCEDHTVSHEKFNIVSCDACDFKFTNPVPESSQIGRYYQSDNYISHSDTKKGVVSKAYHLVRNYTLKKKLDLMAGYVSRGTVLDYGCGTGMFVDACRNAGWTSFGLEPDAGARKLAFERGLNVSSDKAVLDQRTRDLKFNAITLWHVLEHVYDLTDSLEFFKRKLAREGVLIIAVPNHKSYDARHYGEFWAAYDVPRHLYHFSQTTLQRLLSDHGFKLEKVYPMKFDSFYVSMLSERYKTGRTNYFKAVATGIKSNTKAASSGEYSSLIYVFSHAD